MLNAWVPMMIMQPIIENSFIHGFERVKKHCKLEITACRQSDKLVVEVADNGAGMSPEKVKDILQLNFPESINCRASKLGLLSVHKRLQMMFGSDYSLDIRSNVGEGTSVKFFIPYVSDPYFYRQKGRLHNGENNFS